MTASVRPFLMFEGSAEAAINFYVELFPDAEIVAIERYGPEGPGPDGTVFRASFRLADQTILCIDSPAKHAFGFTPSISLFVECDSEAELERLAASLGEGGKVLMPLGDYGFSRRFTWVEDRFGVSWQLNLPHTSTSA